MWAPFELQALAILRRRGQCPQMTVFVTDRWQWATKLEELGCLAIRIRRQGDFEHDWGPLGGLAVILLQASGDYASIGQAILAANPSRFETFTLNRGGETVIGDPLPWKTKMRRDELIVRHLISEQAA